MSETKRQLVEVYIDVQTDEGPVNLECFLERVTNGEFGAYNAEEIEDFLRRTERDMLDNMHQRAGMSAGLEAQLQERVHETRDWIDNLIKRYAGGTQKRN